jgi:hypothetical protein
MQYSTQMATTQKYKKIPQEDTYATTNFKLCSENKDNLTNVQQK